MIHLVRAFFWLQAHMARQHRSALISQMLQFLIFLLIFARLPIENRDSFFKGVPFVQFILTGLVYQIFYESVMNGPTSRLNELQMTGQLQTVLAAPYPRWMILLAAGGVSSIFGMARAAIVFIAGIFFFDAHVEIVSWPALIGALVYTLGLSMGLALLNIASALTWPRLNLTSFFNSLLLGVLSGVFLPIDRLPQLVRPLAQFNPLRWGLDLFRSGFGEHTRISSQSAVAAVVALAIVQILAVVAYRYADVRLTTENRYQYF